MIKYYYHKSWFVGYKNSLFKSFYILCSFNFYIYHWKIRQIFWPDKLQEMSSEFRANFLDKNCIIWYLGNVTWQAPLFNIHFQDKKYDISCTFPVSEIWCVLHISQIKDTVHFLYMSCNTRNFIFHVHFQEDT